MTATPPVRVRVVRRPADPAAEVTVGRSYQATVDEDGRAVVVAGGAGAGARLQPGEYEFTRWWLRNSRDPGYQGDGWRWSLSLWLPGVRLPRWVRRRRPTLAEAHAALQARREFGSELPWTLDLLPLTGEQRAPVWATWLAVQRKHAALACSLGAHVWRHPEAAARPLSGRRPPPAGRLPPLPRRPCRRRPRRRSRPPLRPHSVRPGDQLAPDRGSREGRHRPQERLTVS